MTTFVFLQPKLTDNNIFGYLTLRLSQLIGKNVWCILPALIRKSGVDSSRLNMGRE